MWKRGAMLYLDLTLPQHAKKSLNFVINSDSVYLQNLTYLKLFSTPWKFSLSRKTP
jgi:hypothetical protein